jgi:hypothetical protein
MPKWAGDGTSILSTIPESLVNIAHIRRFKMAVANAAFQRLPRFRSMSRKHDDCDHDECRDQRKSAIQ